MGNLFSRRTPQYHRIEESMVELETMLNAYDNRLAVCEECKKEDDSVSQNLIINGYKICNSCKVSKTLFPV